MGPDPATAVASAPAEFYVFVDRTSLATRSNYDLTGGFTSRCAGLLATTEGVRQYESGEIDLLPFRQNPDQFPFLSPFVTKLTAEQWIEWEAERLRRTYWPTYPSRLSGIYAFGDRATCEQVAELYGWDLTSVRRFELAAELPWRAVRVNMEVVSLMRATYRLAMWETADADHIWKHYWSGAGNLQVETPGLSGYTERRTWNSGVVWEWLIEGQLVAKDKSPVFGASSASGAFPRARDHARSDGHEAIG